MSEQTVPLGTVAYINPTVGALELEADEFVDFVPMAAVEANQSISSSHESRPYGEVKKGYTSFVDGDILLAKITPCFENGKISQIRLNSEVGFGSTEFHVVRPRADMLDGRYLVHLLRQEKIRTEGERRMTGSAGQRRVPKSFLESLPIFLPPISEQRRIAAILDTADALSAKRREALAQLDHLAQSIFVEMFGDPVTNTKGLPVVELETLCRRVTDGTHQSPEWVSDGIPFLFISNIVDGEITFDTSKYISSATYDELTRRCPIEQGDVLFTTVGSYGNTAVILGDRKFCFQRHIAHIKPAPELLDSEFCAAMLESVGVRRQVDAVARGVAQKTVNLADLKRLRVFAPTLHLQRSFTNRLDAVRSLKRAQKLALAEHDGMFRALQARAFVGEL